MDNKLKSRYVFHSLKIEGSPYSLEDVLRLIKGEETELSYSRRDTEEVTDLIDSIDFLYQNIDISNLDGDFIRVLHSFATHSDQSFLPGMFKIDPNYACYNGIEFNYTDPLDVEREIREMCGEFNNSSGDLIDIAQMIGEFIKIHPFRDGNGRVQRLLLLWALERNNFEPVVIHYEDLDDYIYALNEYRLTSDPTEIEYLLERLGA